MSAQQLHSVRQKVLVVDDDPVFRELLTDLLESKGCHVLTAQDGLAGLDALHNGPFDLILVDYRMPGITGLEMAAFIRRSDTVTPIILITGDYYTLAPEIIARAGITRVLPKPLRINEFLSICLHDTKINDISTTRHKEANGMSRAISKQVALGVLALALMTGCAGMSTRQQRALSGGAIGAAGGAAIGAIAGSPTTGAIVGGAVGTATGALWDDIKKSMK